MCIALNSYEKKFVRFGIINQTSSIQKNLPHKIFHHWFGLIIHAVSSHHNECSSPFCSNNSHNSTINTFIPINTPGKSS